MKYDFVEIGTCDYHTLLESCNANQKGLSVEPIKTYLDRLPNRDNVTKVNVAISSKNEMVDLYWVEPHNQEKYNLGFTKGWGTIKAPHKGHQNAETMLSDGVLSKQIVEAITWSTLVDRYQIESVDYVKIDAEGHDCVIVNSVLDSTIRPIKISFEKTHCPSDDLKNICERLIKSNYILVEDGEDMVWKNNT
jgi:FkbM family methyltransferase